MLCRWDTKQNNLNFALHEVKRLTEKLIRKRQGRSRPPKRDLVKYVQTIVIEEFCEGYSLRKAEVRLTKFVVGKIGNYRVKATFKPDLGNSVEASWEFSVV